MRGSMGNCAICIHGASQCFQMCAVKINQNIIEDKDILITRENFIAHPEKKEFYYSIVFVGKKKYGLVELIS